MNALSVAVVCMSLAVAAAGLVLLVRIRSEMREIHARLHRLERTQQSDAKLLASLSRNASRTQLLTPGLDADCRAQHGEEFYLWERLGFKPQGTFIEIGAYNGTSLSNSFFFGRMGWRGLLVEAHPDLAEKCRQARPDARVVHAALGETDGGNVTFSMVRGDGGMDTLSYVSTTDSHRKRIQSRHGVIEQVEVPARTLSSVLSEIGMVTADWMSVDVEGAEMSVLRGAALDSFRPKLILVEDNSGGRNDEVGRYLAGFGYRLVQTIGCNDLYERQA